MRTEYLDYFVKVVEIGTISAAAELLYISPQGLSQAIQQLEKELGAVLFCREGSKLHLTAAGSEAYDRHLKSFPNSKTPVPFVKKACFSGALDDGHSCILLDGHNNKGFSGGPVCFKPVDSAKKTMSIAAVVSGYRFEKQKVFDKNDQETESYIKSNTGIIVAYDIQEAIEIAKHWNT